jgi:uncharacterized protein (TIGR02246 family)
MKTLVALALSVAVVSPAYAADFTKADAQKLVDKWVEAYDSHDAAALTALYTKDVFLLPSEAKGPINGSEAAKAYFTEWLKQPVINGKVTVTEAEKVGPKSAFMGGTWTGDVPGQNGAPNAHIGGMWMSVVAEQENGWLIRADTWNMPQPPAPQTASGSSKQ